MRPKRVLFVVFFLIVLSSLILFIFEYNKFSKMETQELLYSENVNEDLGPHTEKYRQDFPVVAGASNIAVRLLIDEFDSDDYGNIRLILYDNNNQPVANDTFHQLEKYLDVSSKKVSPGEWHIIVSIEKELGANTVNVGGNINVFGRDLNSTIISSQLQNPSDLENSF